MSMIISSINGFILLPNADLNDVELLDVSVTSKRAMDGTRYTHKKSSTRKKFTFTFSNLPRHKMFELQTFLKTNKALAITIQDWDGVSYHGFFDDAMDLFQASRRTAGGNLRNESGSLTLTFIGE